MRPKLPLQGNKKTVAEGYDQQFKNDFEKDLALTALQIKRASSWSGVDSPVNFTADRLAEFKDMGVSPNQSADMDQLLGLAQSKTARAFNVIAQGIAQAPSAFLEPLGYGADYALNEAWQTPGERDFANPFNDALKNYEAGVADFFKVYTGHLPDEPTPLSGGWWAKNGASMIRSTLGYYPYGMMSGKFIGGAVSSMLTQGLKAKAAKELTAAMFKQAGGIEKASRLSGALATTVSQNYSEHIIEAERVFNNNYEKYAERFTEAYPELSTEEVDEKARNAAGIDAEAVIQMGKLNMLWELPSNYLLFKGPQTSRALSGMATGGRAKTLQKSAMLLEPVQEYNEEVWTGFVTEEGMRKAEVANGNLKNDYSTILDRWTGHVLSYEGVTEGLSGAFGSGPFATIAAVRDHKARKLKLESAKEAAALGNDDKKFNALNEISLFESLYKHASQGTYESFTDMLDGVANMSAEEASKQGFEEGTQEKAREFSQIAADFEQEFNAHRSLYTQEGASDILIMNRYMAKSVERAMDKTQKAIDEKRVGLEKLKVLNDEDAGVAGIRDKAIKRFALEVQLENLEKEYKELSQKAKDNKERTQDTNENGSDIQKKIKNIKRRHKKAKKKESAEVTAFIKARLAEDDSLTHEKVLAELSSIVNEQLEKRGSKEQELIELEAYKQGLLARFENLVDDYDGYISNPSSLKEAGKKIVADSKKNSKEGKAAAEKKSKKEKAKKEKAEATANKNKVKEKKTKSTKEKKKEEATVSGDEAAAMAEAEALNNAEEEVPAEILAEVAEEEAQRSIQDYIDSANTVSELETIKMLQQGNLSPQDIASIDSKIEALKNINKESTQNAAEADSAEIDSRVTAKTGIADNEIRNKNFEVNLDGSINFENSENKQRGQERIEEEVKEDTSPNSSQGKNLISIRTAQIIDGARALAYLATDFTSQEVTLADGRTIFIRKTISADKNTNLVPEVESPNHIQPGTKLTLRVISKDKKGLRYEKDEDGNQRQVPYTYDTFLDKNGLIKSDIIPIEIVAEVNGVEEVIGFLHEYDWIAAELSSGQSKNVLEEVAEIDNWSIQKNDIRTMRKAIVSSPGQSVESVITEVTAGKPLVNVHHTEGGIPKTVFLPLKESMPDHKNIPLVIARGGIWQTAKGEAFDGVILADKEAFASDGRIAVILPTKQKGVFMAIPVWNNTLEDRQVDTIIGAVVALKNKDLAKEVSGALGMAFDTSNAGALAEFVNRITYAATFEFDNTGKTPNDTVYLDVNPKSNVIILAQEGDRVIYTNKASYITEEFKKENGIAKVLDITAPENRDAVAKLLKTKLPAVDINQINVEGLYKNVELSAQGGVINAAPSESYNSHVMGNMETHVNGTNSFQTNEGTSEYVYINQPVIQFSPSFAIAKKKEASSSNTINIYAGTNENAELSNFAIRPFSYDEMGMLGKVAGDFQTVEGAFQAQKILYTASERYRLFDTGDVLLLTKEGKELLHSLETATGAQAKKIGRGIKDVDVARWDAIAANEMKAVITDSFQSNPLAAKALLATEDATLTHTQDKGKWGKLFPQILMEVRAELVEGLKQEQNYQEIEESEDALLKEMEESIKEDLDTYGAPLDRSPAPAEVDISELPTAFVPMSVDHANQILAGKKTTTIRSLEQKNNIGIAEGMSAIVEIKGKTFKITNRGRLSITEAGGQAVMLASEGFKSIEDVKFTNTKAWLQGGGKLFVYDLQEVVVPEYVPTETEVALEANIVKRLSPIFIDIDNMSAEKQEETLGYVVYRTLLYHEAGHAPKKAFRGVLAYLKSERTKAIKKGNTAAVKDYDIIIGNWGKVETLTEDILSASYGLTVSGREDRDQGRERGIDLEKTFFDDESRFREDPKKKASKEVKIMLSKIPRTKKVDGDLVVATNFLGLPMFYTLDQTWDRIIGPLSETLPGLDSKLSVLDEMGETVSPVFATIAKRVRKLSIADQNSFVTQMNSAYIDMIAVLYNEIDTKLGFEARVISAGATKASESVVNGWVESQKENSELISISPEGESYINTDFVKKLEEDFTNKMALLNPKSAEALILVGDTLSKLGIAVPMEVLQELSTSSTFLGVFGETWEHAMITRKGKKKDKPAKKTFMSYIFNGFLTNVPSEEQLKAVAEDDTASSAIYKNNPLRGRNYQGVIKKLADIVALYGDKMFPKSYRDTENKSVNPFQKGTTMHSMNNMYKNANNDSESKGLVEDMKKTHLGSTSVLLPQIVKAGRKGKILNIQYTDGIKNRYRKTEPGVKRKDQGILQQELYSAWMFQRSGAAGNAKFFGITKADRGISEVIDMPKTDVLSNITVKNGRVESIAPRLVDKVMGYVLGEISRVVDMQAKVEENPKHGKKEYREGAQLFHLFPFLNQFEEGSSLYDGETSTGHPKFKNTPANILKVQKLVEQFLVKEVNSTVELWQELNIVTYKNNRLEAHKLDAEYMDKFSADLGRDAVAKAAADLDINYVISNIEQMILFGGDPAGLHVKGKSHKETIILTAAAYQKRLIGTDAPRAQGNHASPQYTAVTSIDKFTFSSNFEQLKKLLGDYSGIYEKIKAVDAQEFTTVQEHIDVLLAFGQIDDVLHAKMSAKIEAAIADPKNTNNFYSFTEEESVHALKPMKPIYDRMHPDGTTGELARFYRKSMSLPLLPTLTSDFSAMDRIRIAMENSGTARLGHDSSDKMSPFGTMDAWGEMTIAELTSSMKEASFSLYRSGFGIQQEKPIKKVQKQSMSSQFDKIMFSGTLKKTFKFRGKEISGLELRDKKENIMSDIYTIRANRILAEYGVKTLKKEDGTEEFHGVDMQAFVSRLEQEAKSRGWQLNDILSITVDKSGESTLMPLPFIPSRVMLEGLLMSIVNGTTNVKLPGITFIQAAGAGYKNKASWSELSADKDFRNSIVTTVGFDETKGLQGPRWDEEKGEVIPGQIMVKFYYRDDQGNEMDIMATTDGKPYKEGSNEYVFLYKNEKNGKLFLNPTKVPKSVRELMGYRIPFQNHASAMPLEIVGFLPKDMEITAVVPDEMVAQMGSDFDVDVLNSYFAQYVVHKDAEGNVKGVFREKQFESEEDRLLTEYYDIVWAVMTSNKDVYKTMSQGIDDPELELLADQVDNIRRGRQPLQSPSSRRKQIDDNITQRMGQTLIGVAAQAITMDSIMEGHDISIGHVVDGVTVATTIEGMHHESGGKLVFSSLSKENRSVYVKNGKELTRSSSDVINIIANAAIDNANKPTPGKLNFNMSTLPVGTLMAHGGVSLSTIGLFMAQDIMWEYSRQLDLLAKGISEEASFDNESLAIAKTLEKFTAMAGLDGEVLDTLLNEFNTDKILFRADILSGMLTENEGMTSAMMAAGVDESLEEEAGKLHFDYALKQIAVLRKFQEFKTYSDKLNKIRKPLSDTTTKGLTSSIYAAKVQMGRIEDLVAGENTSFTGIASLSSRQYVKLGQTLSNMMHLFDEVYPVTSPLLENIEETFIENSSLNTVGEAQMKLVFDSVLSMGWSHAVKEVLLEGHLDREGNPLTLLTARQELFRGPNNIAALVRKAKKSHWGENNPFLGALTPFSPTNKTLGVASLGFNGSVGSELNRMDLVRGFASLFRGNAEARRLGRRLLMMAYLNGGNQTVSSFIRVVPFGAIEGSGLTEVLKDVNFKGEALSFVSNASIVEQMFQHYPWYAAEVDVKTPGVGKLGDSDTTGLVLPSIEEMTERPEEFGNILREIKMPQGGVEYGTKAYISVKDGKKHQLFRYLGIIDNGGGRMQYERIDLKGSKRGLEFDSSGESRSYVAGNKAVKEAATVRVAPTPVATTPSVQVRTANTSTTTTATPSPVTQVDIFDATLGGNEQLKAALGLIVDHGSETGVVLARALLNKGGINGFQGIQDSKILGAVVGAPILAAYDNNNKRILIDKSRIQAKTSNEKMTILMHEIVHGYYNEAILGKDTSPAAKRFKAANHTLWIQANNAYVAQTFEGDFTDGEIKEIAYLLSNEREFTAGALTSEIFQKYLNGIKATGFKTLLEKITDAVISLVRSFSAGLGFTVNEKSLLEYALRESFAYVTDLKKQETAKKNKLEGLTSALGDGDTLTLPKQLPKDSPKASEVVETLKKEVREEAADKANEEAQTLVEAVLKTNSDKVVLVGQEGYKHSESEESLVRVSSFYLHEEFTGSDKLREVSTGIGNSVDIAVRMIFAGRTPLQGDVPNLPLGVLNEEGGLADSIKTLKKDLDKKGFKIVTDEIILSSLDLGVAGTTDLILINPKGEILIYDVKSVRNGIGSKINPDGSFKGKNKQWYQEKWTNQLNMYRLLAERLDPRLKVVGLGIMPVAVSYNEELESNTSMAILEKTVKIEMKLPQVMPENVKKFSRWMHGEKDASSADFKKENPRADRNILSLRATPLTFTSGQEKALLMVSDFIQADGFQATNKMLLAGYAGTGKTTIVENIYNYAISKGKSVVITAPTNKAAQVLREKLDGIVPGEAVMTNHKYFTHYDEKTGIYKPSDPKDTKDTVHIMDEASMLDSEMLAHVDRLNFKGMRTIFLGDSAQLPPVKADPKLFEGGVALDKNTELTEVKRQALESPVLAVATAIRNLKRNVLPSESVPDFTRHGSPASFQAAWLEKLNKGENVMMISQTNPNRIAFNNAARVSLYGADRKIIEDGEVLVSVSNSGDAKRDTSGNVGVFNSELIGEARDKTYTVLGAPISIHIGYNNKVTLHPIQDEIGNIILLSPDGKAPSLYHSAFLSENTKGMNRSKAMANEEALAPYLKPKENGKGLELPRSVILAYYGYAITAHKAQGSQWDQVFVDQSWDGVNSEGIQVVDLKKWMYTAITRAAVSIDVSSRSAVRMPMSALINAASGAQDAKESLPTNLPKNTSWESLLAVAKKHNKDYEKASLEQVKEIFGNDLASFELHLHQEINSQSNGIDGMIDVANLDLADNLQGEFKEIAFNLTAKIAELKRRKTSATSLNARNYIDSQVTRLEDDIKRVSDNATVATIRHVALEQLKWAESILDRSNISTNELIDASNIADVWDYTNSTRHVLSDSQASNKNNPTRKILEEIGAVAAGLETSLAAKRLNFAKEQVKTITNESIINPGESVLLLDKENWFISNLIGLTDFKSPLIRTFDSILKDINRAASDNALNDQKELEGKMKEFKEELKRLGLDESIMLQKDSDGNPSGYLVSQYSDKYYKDTIALRQKLNKELTTIQGLATSNKSKKTAMANAWRKYFMESNRMELVIDTRFWEKEGHTSKEASSVEEYIAYLQKELGEDAADTLIEQAKKKVETYKLELEAYNNKLSADVADGVIQPIIGKTLMETVGIMQQGWVRRNDPSVYLAHRDNAKTTTLDSGKLGWKRTIKVPRPSFSGGTYYNSDFKTIESSEALSSFYAYYSNKMNEYKSYIPEVDEHQLSANFFPVVQKDLIETYIREGSMAALKAAWNGVGVYSALLASDTETLKGRTVETKAQRDVKGKIMPQIPRRFMHEQVELNDRSFDIERVLTMFGSMAHNYKAKAAAEPTINLLHRTIEDAVETIKDNRGNSKTRPNSAKKLYTKNSPASILEAVTYAKDGMMYGKVREEVQKTTLELPGNLSFKMRKQYKESKQLRADYKKLEESLNEGKITQEEFNAKEKAMEESFKGLDIKAFSFNKLMRGLLNYTQLKQLGWNWTAGIANVGFGVLASNIHAAGEEDFTASNMRTAFKIILKSSVSSGTSKAANVMQRMGVLFEMREAEYGVGKSATKSRLKFLSKLAPMEIQQSTEFVVQGLSTISKMLNTPVTNLKGEERNLYEAYNEDGSWNTAEFGSSVEWSSDNVTYKTRNKYTSFRNSAIEMNKKLHGNYDPNSLIKFKSKDIRLLLTIFRTWMFEGFNTRLSSEVMNNQLGRKTKGRYRTYLDLGLQGTFKALFKIQVNNFTGSKTKLDGVQNNLDVINMKKNLKEIHMYATLMALGLLLKGLAGEEEEEDQRIFTLLNNLLSRIQKDILFYTSLDTFTDLIGTITPILKTVTDFIQFGEGFKSWLLKEDYRGDHPAWKALKLFPGLNQIPKTNSLLEKTFDQSYGYGDYMMDNYFDED